MAAHYNILAWRIPWTEEPGGLQAIGVTYQCLYYNIYMPKGSESKRCHSHEEV